MREILFKAKILDNGEWVCWNIYGELCRLSGKRTRLAIKNGATTHYYDYIYQVIERIDKNTICQYTGLTDKNGNKVFIGDIVRCSRGCAHEVIWLEEYGGTYVGGMPAIYLSRLNNGYAWTNSEEVIGNIFDNKDLLQ